MSTMRKVLLAICFALFTSVTLMGCGGNDPNVDVHALAEGIGHGDTAAMKDFKLTGDGAKPISEVFIKELGKSLSATQEGMDSAQKIMGDKLKELKIKTEVVSKSDNSAKVKITTDYIEFASVMMGSMQKMEKEIEKMDPNDMSALDKFGDMYLKLFSDDMKNAKVAGQQAFEIDVKKDKDTGKWVPGDVGKFQEDLARYMLFKGGDDSILDEMK
jgi:lipoprotein